ncbi:MAG: hypothetical protein WAX33_06605 [Rectinemataceae bacterium]
MRYRHYGKSFAPVFFLFAAICLSMPATAEGFLQFDATAGPSAAISKAPDMDPALHAGFKANFGLDYTFSFRGKSGLGQGGAAFSVQPSIDGRVCIETGFSHTGQSAILSDGSLYRAWDDFGWGILAGAEFPPVPIGRRGASMSIAALAGGGLRASRYSHTTLVSAYPALLCRLESGFSFPSGQALIVVLPLELAFRAGGFSTSASLSVGAAFGLMPGRTSK